MFRSLLGSVEAFLLKKAEEEPEGFDQNYIVAASFEDVGNNTIVTALFNNQAYHSPAVALALVDNVLFKLLSGARASIVVVNNPQPMSLVETTEDFLYQYVQFPFSRLKLSHLQCFSLYHIFLSFLCLVLITNFYLLWAVYLNCYLSPHVLSFTGALEDIILLSACFLE